MKKLAVAFAALTISSMSASAADMAVKARPPLAVDPAYNWSGFYIGVNAGYGWNNSQNIAVSGSPLILVSQPATVPFTIPGLKPEGWLAGGQIGWNYQVGRIVWGIEADFQGADITNTRNIDLPAVGPLVRTSATEKIDFFGTVRGRVGFTATDRFLIYATGGLAYANVEDSANINEFFNAPVPGRQFRASASDIRYGWTVGGGLEWAFARNWSVKGEYLYYDLGSRPTLVGPQTNPANGIDFATYSGFHTRGSIARAGLNYKFDWAGPVVARY
jgi:outer membrane immunogenic protein